MSLCAYIQFRMELPKMFRMYVFDLILNITFITLVLSPV